MKKSSLALFLILTSNCLNSVAQKITEGKIVYEISVPDMETDKDAKDMIPTESIFYFKDNQIRMEMKMMGMSTVVITNPKDKSATTLMDLMGSKYAIRMTEADIEKEKEKMTGNTKFDIKITDETKMIAGYKCKKAIASAKDANDVVIYFTNDIIAKNQSFNEKYKGIDGFPMEYQMGQSGINMKFVAKSVSKEKVAASQFIVPSDYKITTKEELAKMFGGGK